MLLAGYDPNAPDAWPPRAPPPLPVLPARRTRTAKANLQGQAYPMGNGATLIVVSEDSPTRLSCLVDGVPKIMSRSWVLELRQRSGRS